MTSRLSRSLLACLAAAVVAGCTSGGETSGGEDRTAVDAGQVLGDLADRLATPAALTYTAEYTTSHATVTVVRQPDASAFLSQAGRFILTARELTFCETDKGKTRCEMASNHGTTAGEAAGLIAGVAGPGFITPERVAGLLDEVADASGVTVERAERTIGGQPSACATASGIAKPSRKEIPAAFSLCVTDTGVLASFHGTLPAEGEVTMDLASYADSADAGAFAVPAQAEVVEVDQIGLPPR